MTRICSIIIVVLLLCSCAVSQKIVVPSKKFSIMGPPAPWKTLVQSEFSGFPIELNGEVPGELFTAYWSRDNMSRIGLIVGKIPDPTSSSLPDKVLYDALHSGLKKDMERLRQLQCKKDLEVEVDSEKEVMHENGIREYQLLASLTCTSYYNKRHLKILLSMFVQNDHLYSYGLYSFRSNFNRDRKVLEAMIASLVFHDQRMDLPAIGETDAAYDSSRIARAGPSAENRFIQIQEPDVVFAYGKVKYTVNLGDTLQVVREKTCRSGKGRCWLVKHVVTGVTGAVAVKRMESRHRVYSAVVPEQISSPPPRDIPPRTLVEVLEADKVNKGRKKSFTVTRGERLEVLLRKTCSSGVGECWGVRNMETGEFGYVKADWMRLNHRVYTEPEK